MTCIAQLFEEISEILDIEESDDKDLNALELLQTVGAKFHAIGEEISDWTPNPELESQLNEKLDSEGLGGVECEVSDLDCRIDNLEEHGTEDHEERICSLEGIIEEQAEKIDAIENEFEKQAETIAELATVVGNFIRLYQEREGLSEVSPLV